ncbi:hypothetical protein QWT87_20135 [Chryseobacterium sp. APV1]|uniref:ResB-like domain-containing protein n=1 Tax=Chryseobacterium urinae TaxID=3058400 RepID=A0ABT8UC38_9FLAO|nr:hypothetical protein [Chryseobacterium sp. APV1]MDO3427193.1 hypothetical protein [Chryseobacterium sp. APV1]
MSGFREFKYSIIIFIIGLITTSFIFIPSYWLFNIHPFPPKFGFGTWIFAILFTLIPAYSIEMKFIQKFRLSEKRKDIILFSSLLCILIIQFGVMNLMNSYKEDVKAKTTTVEKIYESRSPKLFIEKFEVINEPIIYKTIKENTNNGTRYLQIYFLYHFIPNSNTYYSLKFEELSDTNFIPEEMQMGIFMNRIKSEMQNYDFQKIKTFKYLTITDPDYDSYGKAVSDYSGVFLQPINKKDDEDLFLGAKIIVVGFLLYLVIFLLSRVEDWK